MQEVEILPSARAKRCFQNRAELEADLGVIKAPGSLRRRERTAAERSNASTAAATSHAGETRSPLDTTTTERKAENVQRCD
jgi:hypothetical protein